MDIVFYPDALITIDPVAECIFKIAFAVITIHAMCTLYNYKFGKGERDGDKL